MEAPAGFLLTRGKGAGLTEEMEARGEIFILP